MSVKKLSEKTASRTMWAAGVGAALLTFGLALASFHQSRLCSDAGAEWVSRGHRLMQALGQTQSLLERTESVQGEYLLYGGEGDHAAYLEAVKSLRRKLHTVRELTADDQHQQRSFETLKGRIEGRLARLAEGVAVRRAGGTEFTARHARNTPGVPSHDGIDNLVYHMKRTEIALLRERSARATLMADATSALGMVAGGLAFALVIAVSLLVLRDLSGRRRLEKTRARLATIIEASDDAIFENTPGLVITSCNAGAERLYGYGAKEIVGEPFHRLFPPDRRDDIEHLRTRAECGQRVDHYETVNLRRDRVRIDVSLTVSPAKNAAGEVTHVSTIVRDITEQKRSQRRAAAQHAVTRVLAESDSLRDAASQLLSSVCSSLDWQVGVLWEVDGNSDALRNVDVWNAPGVGGDFAAISRVRTYARGVGLPGRVWASQEPAWVDDITAENDFPAGSIAAKDGLRGAVAFPIRIGAEVLGVIAFLSYRLHQPDEALLAMMTAVGSQIGQFIERKRIEEQTYRTQQYLADFLENATVGLDWVEPDGRIAWANQAKMKLLGYTAEEYIGEHIADFHVDRQAAADMLERLARNETLREYETRLRCKDGSIRHVIVDASVLWERGRFVHARCFTRDITQRKLAQEEAARSEHRLAVQYAVTRILAESDSLAAAGPRILQVVGEGFGWEVGVLWRTDERAQRLCRLATWPAPAPGGIAAFGHGGSRALDVGLPGRIWSGKKPVWVRDIAGDPELSEAEAATGRGMRGAFAFPILLGEQILGVLEFCSSKVREPDENTLLTASALGSQIAQFIEHRQVEQARARLAAIVESSDDAIVGNALDGTIASWNRGAQRIYGWAAQEVTGRPMSVLVPADRADEVPGILRSIGEGATVDHFETVHLHRDGRRIDVSVTVSPVWDAEGRIVGGASIARDISEQKQAEIQLRQAQKLEAVGRLAAGIAHEINTPIQFIGDNTRFLDEGFTSLRGLIEGYRALLGATGGAEERGLSPEVCRMEQGADLDYLADEIPKAIGQTLEGVDRVATIVRAMKDFAHADSLHEKAPADLNHALLSSLTVARNEIKYVADVETDLGELPPVFCQVGELNQVFLNLLVNAAHSIADAVAGTEAKGRIRVRTAVEGETALIAISDSGCGIPDDVRNRIFDPFFTTKKVGQGSGQGLAIAHAVVVEKHGGSLTFESEVGRGTTFFIRIPIDPRSSADIEAAA